MIFFYSENTIPKEILLSQKLKNTKIIQDLLKKNNDQIVSIKVPKKGKKRNLMEMVENNIDIALNKKISEKKKEVKILEQLRLKLKLNKTPKRIEIYDNSHLNGSNPVGAMVTYENLIFMKSAYRKFNIKTYQEKINDDYFMMKQVFERRFKLDKEWKKKYLIWLLLMGEGAFKLS